MINTDFNTMPYTDIERISKELSFSFVINDGRIVGAIYEPKASADTETE